jgi:hypothetical protein
MQQAVRVGYDSRSSFKPCTSMCDCVPSHIAAGDE